MVLLMRTNGDAEVNFESLDIAYPHRDKSAYTHHWLNLLLRMEPRSAIVHVIET